MSRGALYIITTLLLAITARSNAQQFADDKQLQEVIIQGDKHKRKSLSGRGIRIPGAVSILTPDKIGHEVGSVLSVKHPFEVKEIEFDIISNNIKDVTLQVAIYRDITFTEVLSQPILINIPEGRKQTIVATPTENILLEPDDYIVAITLADCDEEILQQWTNSDQWDNQTRYRMMKQSIQFPLYLKTGYMKSNAPDVFEKCTASIGLKVKGVVIVSI